jgi:hypothetical protein
VAAQLGGDLTVQICRWRRPTRSCYATPEPARTMTLRPALQRRTLVSAQDDLGSWSSAMCHGVLLMLSTTPGQRDTTAKIPDQPQFLNRTTFQDTSCVLRGRAGRRRPG